MYEDSILSGGTGLENQNWTAEAVKRYGLRRMQQSRSTPAEKDTLGGTVERVTYHNEETGFTVLRVKADGRSGLSTVVGHIPHIVPGEFIRARGEWVVNRDHGPQFAAADLKVSPPDSIEGIEKFLGSGLIKGIGPVYAAKLVKTFGKDIFDIIDKESARLEEVDGIGRVRRLLIKEGWNEARSIRSIMTFLLSNGAGTARAFRIYKTYGEQAIAKVRDDPYCLARDIRGIGFKTADMIAAKLGIEKTSDVRARAGVEHVLQECTLAGHCACPPELLVEKATAILEIDETIIGRAIEHGLLEGRLTRDEDTAGQPLLYLTPLYMREVELAGMLKTMAHRPSPCPAIDLAKAIPWVEEKIGLTLADRQKEALGTALRSGLMVITGGPGVGKTTLVNAIIRVLKAKQLSVVLCAPTGRAAKRLNETTGEPAATIHRMLEVDPATGNFKRGPRSPLTGDVFIVDEASMLDLPLAHSLVRSIPGHASLIFVGDVDQLPSVGPGSVLRDMIQADVCPVCRLDTIFRQAARRLIVTAAHAINRDEIPEGGTDAAEDDFFFIHEDDPARIPERIVQMVRHSIPEKTGLHPLRDIQVLSPMQRGEIGTRHINTVMQDALNPGAPGVERYGVRFCVGDKVMQIENDYDKDVFNGDIGMIASLDTDGEECAVRFGNRTVTYSFHELDELMPSYAVTIHKSQGSEYPCVVIPVHTQHYVMLQRNLIYTAITRGRKLVILVGTQKAFSIAVGRNDTHTRFTALQQRLKS